MHTSMFRGSTEERGLYRTFTVRGFEVGLKLIEAGRLAEVWMRQ